MNSIQLTGSSLLVQTKAQNALVSAKDRLLTKLDEERGEIGSTLILMAILVGAAILVTTILRGAITDIAQRIADAIGGQDATGGECEGC